MDRQCRNPSTHYVKKLNACLFTFIRNVFQELHEAILIQVSSMDEGRRLVVFQELWTKNMDKMACWDEECVRRELILFQDKCSDTKQTYEMVAACVSKESSHQVDETYLCELIVDMPCTAFVRCILSEVCKRSTPGQTHTNLDAVDVTSLRIATTDAIEYTMYYHAHLRTAHVPVVERYDDSSHQHQEESVASSAHEGPERDEHGAQKDSLSASSNHATVLGMQNAGHIPLEEDGETPNVDKDARISLEIEPAMMDTKTDETDRIVPSLSEVMNDECEENDTKRVEDIQNGPSALVHEAKETNDESPVPDDHHIRDGAEEMRREQSEHDALEDPAALNDDIIDPSTMTLDNTEEASTQESRVIDMPTEKDSKPVRKFTLKKYPTSTTNEN